MHLWWYTVYNCDYSILLWYLTLLLDFTVCIQLHFSLPVRLHFSLPLFLSALNSKSLYFTLGLPLSLFLYLSTISPSISLSASYSISHSWCIYISHSLSPSLHLTPNISIPFSLSHPATVCLCLSLPPLSLFPRCISFSCCLSLFGSVDRLVSLRAALWHGEMELVCYWLCSQDNNSRYWRRRDTGLQGSPWADSKEMWSFKAMHTSAVGTRA